MNGGCDRVVDSAKLILMEFGKYYFGEENHFTCHGSSVHSVQQVISHILTCYEIRKMLSFLIIRAYLLMSV